MLVRPVASDRKSLEKYFIQGQRFTEGATLRLLRETGFYIHALCRQQARAPAAWRNRQLGRGCGEVQDSQGHASSCPSTGPGPGFREGAKLPWRWVRRSLTRQQQHGVWDAAPGIRPAGEEVPPGRTELQRKGRQERASPAGRAQLGPSAAGTRVPPPGLGSCGPPQTVTRVLERGVGDSPNPRPGVRSALGFMQGSLCKGQHRL